MVFKRERLWDSDSERLWDSETTKETLKCFNLERNIEADLHRIARSPELTIENLLEG